MLFVSEMLNTNSPTPISSELSVKLEMVLRGREIAPKDLQAALDLLFTQSDYEIESLLRRIVHRKLENPNTDSNVKG